MPSLVSLEPILLIRLLVLLYTFVSTKGFLLGVHQDPPCAWRQRTTRLLRRLGSTATGVERNDDENDKLQIPLTFVGPYPCVKVRLFPTVTACTTAQQTNETSSAPAIAALWDFVVDTAANINTIDVDIAEALQLNVVGKAAPGVGSAGLIHGNTDLPTFWLGNVHLQGWKEDLFVAVPNVTASALPIANPPGATTAGILGLPFLKSIVRNGGGVKFDWYGKQITICGELANTTTLVQHGLQRVKATRLPVTHLPCLPIQLNDQNNEIFLALLDTGSPITVVNIHAAKLCGIVPTTVPMEEESSLASSVPRNLFVWLRRRFKHLRAVARGQFLTIFGAAGTRIHLVQSKKPISLRIPTLDNEIDKDDAIDFGSTHVYVGELPGLTALQDLEQDEVSPAIVLGMDVLRRKRHMLFCPKANEVWFYEKEVPRRKFFVNRSGCGKKKNVVTLW